MSFPALRMAHHQPTRSAGSGPLPPLRAWVLACLLGLALLQLLMPTLGLMHRVVHNHAASALTSGSASPNTAGHLLPAQLSASLPNAEADTGAGEAAVADTSDSHTLAQRLFDGHASTDCQLLDHLLLGVGVLPVLLAWLAPAPLMRALWSVQALLLRKSAALFHARAPPLEHGV